MTTLHSPSRRRALIALSLAVAAPLSRAAGALDSASRRNGAAPEFAGIETWLNSEPLSMAALRGQVVMVDFWTFACINCVHVLPHVVQWHEKYKDRGLVVVGVHTPEFAFERDPGNVRKAIKDLGVTYPVALDNQYMEVAIGDDAKPLVPLHGAAPKACVEFRFWCVRRIRIQTRQQKRAALARNPFVFLEAEVGIEPAYADLQSAA